MFSLCLFPFVVSHVVVLLNFAHEFLCTTRVRQPEDFRRNKLILIILPTQDKKKKQKKHIVQGLSRGLWGPFSVLLKGFILLKISGIISELKIVNSTSKTEFSIILLSDSENHYYLKNIECVATNHHNVQHTCITKPRNHKGITIAV